MADEKYIKFYKTELFMWTLLFLYTPLGLLLLWFEKHYTSVIRIIITMIFLIIYLQFERFYTDITGVIIVLAICGLMIFNYERKKRIGKLALIDLYKVKKNDEVKNQLRNFINKYDAPSCQFDQLLYFERYLKDKNSLIYTKKWFKTNDQIYVDTIYKRLDKKEDIEFKLEESAKEKIDAYYKDYFSLLVKHVSKKCKLKSKLGSTFLVWRLIRHYSIINYAEAFHKNYDYEFKSLDQSKFDDYIKHYIKLDFLDDSLQSTDFTQFIYYMMIYGPLEGKKLSELIEIHKKVKKEVEKQSKKRRDSYFAKGLASSVLPVVELEPLQAIDELSDDLKEQRFTLYIKDLLMLLGYWFKDCTDCDDLLLDAIIERENVRYGVLILFNESIEKEISKKEIEPIVDLLKNQELRNTMLITNSFFDEKAQELARKNHIKLWTRDTLIRKEKLVRDQSLDQKKVKNKSTEYITIQEIDTMTGKEFETYLASLFKKKGYKTMLTKDGPDYGVDIIIEKNGQRFGIQAKRYKDTVGVDAIYQLVGGLNMYNLSRGYVITCNSFTTPAKTLAVANGVILWDRTRLKEEILEAFGEYTYF